MPRAASLIYDQRLHRWERRGAQLVLAAWALFWIWFGLASGISEHLPPHGLLLHVAVPGLLFAAISFLALRYPTAAAQILLASDALILLAYDEMMGHRGLAHVLYVGSLLAAPPAVAALLLLASRER
jgi:hypothetical protein